MSTYDVSMASTSRSATPAVIITTKTPEAAAEIADVLKKNSDALFQCDGMRFFVRESDRGEKLPEAVPETAPATV